MQTARWLHSSSLLADGRVLITGGKDANGSALASSELFDLGTHRFTSTGNLVTARVRHTATVLANGKVLVAGGDDGTGVALSASELFDPGTSAFAHTGNLTTPRSGHTATLLDDGRVLIAGGGSSSAELFDPNTETFAPAGAMSASRTAHAATLLSSGRVLVAGGTDTNGTALGDLFDPVTATFSTTSTGGTQALNLTGVLLPSGNVLLTGGQVTVDLSGGSTRCCLFGPVSVSNAFLFDDARGDSSTVAGLSTPRASHTATLLQDGRVLIVGGATILSMARGGLVSTSTTPLASAELFDSTPGLFVATGNMNSPRLGHTATLLGNGQVLVTGGIDQNGTVQATTELYQP
jgi:Galactose oxidase, central domain